MQQVVIVGAGHAGFQCCASLRQEGFDGAIVLVGDEASLPYQRPPLSKAYLLAKASASDLHFRPERFPMSTTIFTGAIPIEEFKHDHRLEYERLVAAGELEKHLVKRPSRRADLAASFITWPAAGSATPS